MPAELALLLIALAGCLVLPVIAYRLGRRHGYDAGTDVNLDAVTELNNEVERLLRGATVATWSRPTPHPRADAHYNHILTDRGPLLLTDEAFIEARDRADKLLPKDQ